MTVLNTNTSKSVPERMERVEDKLLTVWSTPLAEGAPHPRTQHVHVLIARYLLCDLSHTAVHVALTKRILSAEITLPLAWRGSDARRIEDETSISCASIIIN